MKLLLIVLLTWISITTSAQTDILYDVVLGAGLTASELLSIDVLTYKLKSENERLNNLLGFYRPVNQFVFSFPARFATLGSGAGFVPFNGIA